MIDKKNAIVIARKTDEELEKSNTTGESAVYNRPTLTKVFDGMTVLEVGKDKVLESTLKAIGTFNKDIHKGYDTFEKDYQWVLYHFKGSFLTIEQATEKYKELETTTLKEGTITYMSKR